MSAELANVIALLAVSSFLVFITLSLLSRVGAWHVSQAQRLTHDEGLRIGSKAPQVAALAASSGADIHLSFLGSTTFVVFGSHNCGPCHELLEVASTHPATKAMRLVFMSDDGPLQVEPHVLGKWEIYRFHDEERARRSWRAPVSPYFYVIDRAGRVVEKGVANRHEHLDRLLTLAPESLRSASLSPIRVQERSVHDTGPSG